MYIRHKPKDHVLEVINMIFKFLNRLKIVLTFPQKLHRGRHEFEIHKSCPVLQTCAVQSVE